MAKLAKKHPQAHAEFPNDNFVVQKSARKFSLITKDHTNKQSIKNFQTHSGAVRLYKKPESLALLMLAGPDYTRIFEEFEAVNDQPLSMCHPTLISS